MTTFYKIIYKIYSFRLFLLVVLVYWKQICIVTGDLSNIHQHERFLNQSLNNNISDEIRFSEIFERHTNETVPQGVTKKTKKRMNKILKITASHSLQCLSCIGYSRHIANKIEGACFRGDLTYVENCTRLEQCYIEIHPTYIRRGCVSKKRLNRTFVCKCPLCNDKPYDDLSYYEYERIRDWEYDNYRLDKPLQFNLICKVCETRGINKDKDKQCKQGSFDEYMMCGNLQLCYTNIELDSSYVSRGCMDMPLYNSYYQFCNKSLCNSQPFLNPYRLVSSANILPSDTLSTDSGSVEAKYYLSSSSIIISILIISINSFETFAFHF